MTDDTVTGWRTRLLRAWGWLLGHPTVLGILAGFLTGATLPLLVRWLL